MDYDEQEDTGSKFYNNFNIIMNEDLIKEIYNEAISNVADENDWTSEQWNEYKNEKKWYESNKKELYFQAEEEAIEEIIRKVFEDLNVNVNRLSGDDFLDFGDYVKEQYPFLDSTQN